jgi:hypothetical protein
VTGRNEHGGDVVVEPWPTFLPHLEHHHILVLFVIISLDTVLHHDRQWNEPTMGNSMAAANAMKSTSLSQHRAWRSTDAQRLTNMGSSQARRSTNTGSSEVWNGSGDVSNRRRRVEP